MTVGATLEAAPQVVPYTGSAADWDTFVRAQPRWSHHHLYGWRAINRDVLGHDTPYLAATTKGRLEGVLPLVRVKSPIFGHFLVSMPFVNYGGPLGTESAVRALVDRAVAMAETEGVGVLELRNRWALPQVDLPPSHRKITVVMDMSGGAQALWKRLDAKVRSQVRRPQKEGIVVRIGADQVEPFFKVFAHHMRDLGTPVMPRAFFDSVARTFPDDVLFACAYHNDQPVACGCGFLWGDEFEITWASALRAYNRMSPNMLVYWELMQYTADRGVTRFNFGRCTPDGGTHKFKQQWGTTDEQLWWYQRHANGAEASLPGKENTALNIGSRLWQKLPVSIATALGPRLVRFLP